VDIDLLYYFFSEKGLKVTAREDFRGTGSKKWDCVVVGIVGYYNKGKTTVLNHICLKHHEFPANLITHTKGLSFKLIKDDKLNVIFLDSAGMFSPAKLPKIEEGDLKCKNTFLILVADQEDPASKDVDPKPVKPNLQLGTAIAEKKATEHFLQSLIYELSSILIVVVDNLTVLDQEFLQTMSYKTSKSGKDAKQIIVVHNFRTCQTEEEARKLWEQQVTDIYPGGKSRTVVVASANVGQKITEKEVRFHISSIGRHIYIVDKGSAYGKVYNNWAIDLLKSWLGNDTNVPRSFDPLKEIESKISGKQSLIEPYISNAKPIRLSDQNTFFKMDESGQGEELPRLRNWTIEGFTIIFEREGASGTEFSPPVFCLFVVC
jgi:hypothetical protein